MESSERLQIKQKINKDCFECKITGSGSMAAIGGYLLYNSFFTIKNMKSPAYRWGLRAVSMGCFYISLARLVYLRPFTHLNPSNVQNYQQERGDEDPPEL